MYFYTVNISEYIMENKNYIVYVHMFKNGKKYVGQTSFENPNDRWLDGYGYISNKRFFREIKRVGWDNIEHIIFDKNLSSSEADFLEKMLIERFDTTNPDLGFNNETGGKNGSIDKMYKEKRDVLNKKAKKLEYGKDKRNYNWYLKHKNY